MSKKHFPYTFTTQNIPKIAFLNCVFLISFHGQPSEALHSIPKYEKMQDRKRILISRSST